VQYDFPATRTVYYVFLDQYVNSNQFIGFDLSVWRGCLAFSVANRVSMAVL
jgi:hypothetical protein